MDENNLDISLDILAAGIEETSLVPVSIMEAPVCNDCGCVETCAPSFEGINDGLTAPTVPTFLPPVSIIDTIIAPTGAVSSPLSYDIHFDQNDAGPVDFVKIYVDGILVYTGAALSGQFPVVLTPGTHEVRTDVHYLDGPPSVDSSGNVVENPIQAGISSNTETITVIGAYFTGTAVNEAAIPGVLVDWQATGVFLNTGTTNKCFWVAVPVGFTISTIEDSNAMYLDLKGLFTFVKNVSVGITNYKVLAMTNAIPYVNNHKFLFDA